MRLGWTLIQNEYPWLIAEGCKAHALHLLAGDFVNHVAFPRNPYFIEFLQKLRPAYKPPSKFTFPKCVDKEYLRIRQLVDDSIAKANAVSISSGINFLRDSF